MGDWGNNGNIMLNVINIAKGPPIKGVGEGALMKLFIAQTSNISNTH